MSKQYSQYVYACPWGWNILAIGKKPTVPIECKTCHGLIKPEEMAVFDSQIEHQKGIELKLMEKAGVIQGLRHHEKFDLAPNLFLTKFISSSIVIDSALTGFGLMLTTENSQKYPAICKVHDKIIYESDFSFYQGEEKRVIEVKDLGKKLITKSIKQSQGSIKIKAGSIPWPFLAGKTLIQFKKRCQLMKAIYGINVEIWAGNRVFKFNEKWKLEEVAK